MPTAWAPRRSARPCGNSAALPYSASASTCPKRAPEARTRSISSSAIFHFGRYATASGTPAAARRAASAPQSSGRKRRRPTPTGTSARARVSETRDWQLAFLPSWPQYWRFTPTECRPCLTSAVSSTTKAASGPPTSRSAAFTSSSPPRGGAGAADEPVGRLHQLVLERRGRPGRGRDEVVQLLGIGRGHPRGHRLDALALARQDQALEVERRPAPLLLAPQPRQERPEPPFEFGLPTVSRRPLHRAPPPRASLRQERSAELKVAA